MSLVGMQDVSVGFGGEPLLANMDLHIESGERIGLLGRNGVGKSTLMKLITGELIADGGTLSRSPGITITSLMQDVPMTMTGTVFDQVAVGLGEHGKLLTDYHIVSHRLASEPDNKTLLSRLDKLGHSLDSNNGWQINQQIEVIIEKMSLDPDAQVANLSAGMKRRVLLAQALVRQPDILLLDEPTNHLDIDTIIWIEEFLERYKGSLIFVSHDRVFIKKLATRIIELDRGRLRSYFCGYETYLKRKEAELEAEAVEQALFDKKLAQEEVWIRTGIKARRTRNEGRVRALKKLRQERSQRKDIVGGVRLSSQDVQQTGRLVIEAKNISFGYTSDKLIVKDFSTTIMRGDKVGILGPNGSGKTTLLRVLLGELEAQKGSIRYGTNLEIAYFDQLHAQLDYSKSVYENVAGGNETIFINGSPRHIVGYLQDFLFTPVQSRNSVANLSGGERNRLLLARLFAKPSNVLVLDEPTNDLDMETLDLLEEFLMNYSGTVLLVSHDREFLNNVVTAVLAMEDSGRVKEYTGGYDDWLRLNTVENKTLARKSATKASGQVSTKQVQSKLSFKEKKELEAMPELIESLEKKQQQLHIVMSEPDFYKNNNDVIVITNKLKELSRQLDCAYSRWNELEKNNSDVL